MSARQKDFAKKLIAWIIIIAMLVSFVFAIIVVVMQQARLGL